MLKVGTIFHDDNEADGFPTDPVLAQEQLNAANSDVAASLQADISALAMSG